MGWMFLASDCVTASTIIGRVLTHNPGFAFPAVTSATSYCSYLSLLPPPRCYSSSPLWAWPRRVIPIFLLWSPPCHVIPASPVPAVALATSRRIIPTSPVPAARFVLSRCPRLVLFSAVSVIRLASFHIIPVSSRSRCSLHLASATSSAQSPSLRRCFGHIASVRECG